MKWDLRMVGGPYDGWTVPSLSEKPDREWWFAGYPYAHTQMDARMFCDKEILPSFPPIPHFSYYLSAAFNDGRKNIAVYFYQGPECERVL